jgi:hypothetical protein
MRQFPTLVPAVVPWMFRIIAARTRTPIGFSAVGLATRASAALQKARALQLLSIVRAGRDMRHTVSDSPIDGAPVWPVTVGLDASDQGSSTRSILASLSQGGA